MEHTKERKGIVEDKVILDETKLIVICKHCGKPIDHTLLIGLSLICPLCGKPQNGQPHLQT